MNDSRKKLEQAITCVLKPLGYRKRAGTWHRDRERVVSVVNLQKSQWGDDWYLNLGVYLKALGDESRPPENRRHIRCRATPTDREMPREPAELAALVVGFAVPWLEALSTERDVAEFLGSARSRGCAIHRRVLDRIGAPAVGPASSKNS